MNIYKYHTFMIFFSKILSTLRRIWYKLYWLTNYTAKECTLVIPSLIVLRIFEISTLEGIWEGIKNEYKNLFYSNATFLKDYLAEAKKSCEIWADDV